MNLNNRILRGFLWLALIIYLVVVGVLCFEPTLPLVIPESNPLPYIYVGKAPFIYYPLAELTHLDFYLNILMTFPLGIFIGLLSRKKLRLNWVLGIGVATGLFIELTQLLLDNLDLTERWIDINDVLANAAGVCLGCWLVWRLFRKIKHKTNPID